MGGEVRVSGLRYALGGREILRGVDARMPEGLITAVLGPSGAGKSTLLRAVNRLIEPSAGEVSVGGVPTGAIDPVRLRRRVGMVFQLPALFGASVGEAVLYGARLAGTDADAGGLLETVGLDPALAARDPETLSVGQQQRVSIARALALRPEVLLMDEPTSALDGAARQKVEDLALGLNARLGLTLAFVSHDLAQVERVADRVVLISEGRSVGEWGKDEFFSDAGAPARQLAAGKP